jgi:hypothetical protein
MPIVWTDVGQQQSADLHDPATRDAVSDNYYGAWGSSATAPAVTQTALGTENAEARAACAISQPAADTVRYVYTITATGNRVVNEFGVFDALTTGNMIIRGTLSTLNIETGDRVEFTIDLTFQDISE